VLAISLATVNFLAHFHLAQRTDASQVGALLGDFVRGTPESLSAHYPPDLIKGIMLHRSIDQFTDHHPEFLRIKKLLSPTRRRFAGIVIDIYFDHFLTLHWDSFSEVPLVEFIEGRYQLLESHPSWLTPELQEIVPRMRHENWLATYQNEKGLALTFERISRRRTWLAPIIEAEKDLFKQYDLFENAFHRFYPEAITFAQKRASS
jgi:acyl carrier protein phosphodiesterase